MEENITASRRWGQASSVPPPRLLGQDSSSWAKVFTKLDLRNAYHLPGEDTQSHLHGSCQSGGRTVTNWPPLTSKKKEQFFPSDSQQIIAFTHAPSFLSRKLSAAERNFYDVGNKELLAVKVALEEWRHWLEGAEQPFIVWTDHHKNLEYLKSAKKTQLSSSKVGNLGTSFFSRFRFTLSYRPGSQNAKPDVLSRLFEPEPTAAKEPETILSPDRVIGLVSWPWPIEKEVQRAGRGKTTPEDCPRNRLFVPEALRSQVQVIHWAHTSLLTCHPGVRRSLFFIQQRFWWPAMKKDVADYVAACAPSVPGVRRRGRPGWDFSSHYRCHNAMAWSLGHFLTLDFITGLPPSKEVRSLSLFFGRSSAVSLAPPSACPLDITLESNGQTERMNQELETCLRCLVAQNQTTWSQHLTWMDRVRAQHPSHSSHGTLAFSCRPWISATSVFGLRTRGYRSIGSCSGQEKSQDLGSCTRDMLQKGQARMKAAADRGRRPAPAYQPGQKVWLSTKDLPLHVHSRKLAPRAQPWSQAWGWGSQASAWWPGLCPRDPAWAQPENGNVGPPSSRLTIPRKIHEGPVQCGLGSSHGGGPRRPNPWTKTLAIGTWNVTSLGGKEPELVQEVERYRLEIVGLTSTHSLGSGIQLERGWTGPPLLWSCPG
ncbi:hypothetical protein L3Q82_002639 [Scortum barcoo]|uniref:Uncharacterized protein n=1 Tax=Scortum barcoo TaxID=214431 RepID=A0ACB8VU50_9TELE|nr:hypothetical protein L3Q82_002639 [Scortum barcoo]